MFHLVYILVFILNLYIFIIEVCSPFGEHTSTVCFHGSVLFSVENNAVLHRPEFDILLCQNIDLLSTKPLVEGLLSLLIGTVNFLEEPHSAGNVLNPLGLDLVEVRMHLMVQNLTHEFRLFRRHPLNHFRVALLPFSLKLTSEFEHTVVSVTHSDSPNIKFFLLLEVENYIISYFSLFVNVSSSFCSAFSLSFSYLCCLSLILFSS